METKDRIELIGDTLLIQFATTGLTSNVSMLHVPQGATFSRDGTTIHMRAQGIASDTKVESFPNESLTAAAMSGICAAMQRYARARRLRHGCRSLVLWLGVPALLFLLVATMNLAISRAHAETPRHSAAPTAHMAPAMVDTAYGAAARLAPADMAQAMADGARSGNYSIKLSSGGAKGALYIFADPLCGACRRIEREYAALAKDYAIHIFPVSVIGGEPSRSRLRKLFCADPAKRAGYWKTLASGREIDAQDCASGVAAVDGNNQVFHSLNLEFTPTIITSGGHTVPESVPSTAAALRQWLEQHDTPANH